MGHLLNVLTIHLRGKTGKEWRKRETRGERESEEKKKETEKKKGKEREKGERKYNRRREGEEARGAILFPGSRSTEYSVS